MPELPEVETLRRGLEKHLVGRQIVGIEVAVPKMLAGTVQTPEEFAAGLQDSRIKAVNRRGKHLILSLDSGYYLLLHLKMRGQLLIVPQSADREKYLAAALTLDDGNEFRFHDMWRWGELRLATETELAAHPSLNALGPEPWDAAWTPEAFRAALQKRAGTKIKAALLDQTLVAGVGNIYADESLFRSRLQPIRPAGSLTLEEATRLRDAIRLVLTEATEGGGMTSGNYVDADGAVGRYAQQVYDRGGQPCPQCGRALTRIKVTGRGTVYCETCQN